MDVIDLTNSEDDENETKPFVSMKASIDVSSSPLKRAKTLKVPPLPLKRLKCSENITHGFKQSKEIKNIPKRRSFLPGQTACSSSENVSDTSLLVKVENLSTEGTGCFPVDEDLDNALTQSGSSYYWNIMNRLIRHCMIDNFEGRLIKSCYRQKLLFFSQFPENEQKLAFRLYMRKSVWQRKSCLKYPEIASNLLPVIDKLISKNILTVPSQDMELSEMLNLLRANELQSVALGLKLPKKSMDLMKAEILKLCKQKCPFVTTKTLKEKVRENCLPYLSDIFRLSKWFITALNYVMFVSTLFAQNLLDLDLFSVNRIVFRISNLGLSPPFQISRSIIIFKEAEHFQIYFGIMVIIDEVDKLMLSKDFTAALKKVKLGYELFADLSESALLDDKEVPCYLRGFSCRKAISKLKNREVEIHCKLKGFSVAAKCLQSIITSTVVSRKRGDDVEKLAKIYVVNLYERAKCVQILREALLEFSLPTHNLMGLAERAHKLRRKLEKVKKSKKDESSQEFEDESPKCWECEFAERKCCKILEEYSVENLDVEEIHGKRAPFVQEHQSLRFIYKSTQQSSSFMCSVEEYVIAHIKDHENFTYGVHKEGFVFTALFHALFADIVYSPGVNNVFFSPYQILPLDWMSKDFLVNRSELIRDRYIDLEYSVKRKDIIRDNCDRFPDLANWSMFENTDSIIELSESFEISQLQKIFTRMFELGSISGMPDLCMWGNTKRRKSKQVLLCEVKGPGDSLSNKQIVWLHYFKSIGVKAKVVHVVSSLNACE